MSRDSAYLLDILAAARLAISYAADQSKEIFLVDVKSQDAVIRRIEIIGEAARRVSEQGRKAHPQLPWQAMVGMRNVMIHDYDDVDLEVVWETVQNDLPALVEKLEAVIPSSEDL